MTLGGGDIMASSFDACDSLKRENDDISFDTSN